MFGWGKNNDKAIVKRVCAKLRPLFVILEQWLNNFPLKLTDDPYVIGYVIGSATIFAQVETQGKASQALRGLVCLSALQSTFAAHGFTRLEASAVMLKYAGHAEVRSGARAADLVIGVCLGLTDKDNEPEIIEAKQAVTEMPKGIREMLGDDPQGLLIHELQEQLFFQPLVAKYGS